MADKEDKGFWAMVGVFIVLWGLTEVLGRSLWWVTGDMLFPVFLVTVGSSKLVKAFLTRPGQSGCV